MNSRGSHLPGDQQNTSLTSEAIRPATSHPEHSFCFYDLQPLPDHLFRSSRCFQRLSTQQARTASSVCPTTPSHRSHTNIAGGSSTLTPAALPWHQQEGKGEFQCHLRPILPQGLYGHNSWAQPTFSLGFSGMSSQ